METPLDGSGHPPQRPFVPSSEPHDQRVDVGAGLRFEAPGSRPVRDIYGSSDICAGHSLSGHVDQADWADAIANALGRERTVGTQVDSGPPVVGDPVGGEVRRRRVHLSISARVLIASTGQTEKNNGNGCARRDLHPHNAALYRLDSKAG